MKGERTFREKGGFEMDISMKAGAEKKPFKFIDIPDIVTICLQQHIGKPNHPLVKEGDMVKTGQKIGDAKGRMVVPIHSSVTGYVEDLKEVYNPVLNRKEKAVIIRRDGNDDMKFLPEYDLDRRKEIVKMVKEAGIVGLGGAAFPTHVKLSSQGIKKLVINAKESDPNLVCDVRLMIDKPVEIVKGIKLMARCLDTDEIIFATRTEEGQIPELERIMKEHGIKVVRVRPSYSVGAEKLLIKEMFGIEVPSGKFPPSVGVVVNNVSTAYAVYRAAYKKEPLLSRGASFYSDLTGIENIWFRNGTSIRQVIEGLGLDIDRFDRIVIGSLMMGWAIDSLEAPLLKYSAGVTALTPEYSKPYEKQLPCIRCGYCDLVCPVDIYPSLIMKAEKADDVKALKRYKVLDCIECSLCSYVCPSQIKLTKHLWQGKNMVNR